MIALRNVSQIPEKIDEIKFFFPNKKEALLSVDNRITHLQNIAKYRYTTESDFEIGQHIIIWNRLRETLSNEQDWEKPKIIEPSLIEKVKKFILTNFSNLFKIILVKVKRKNTSIKKKYLI